jgi:predicted dehydrogenase
MDKPKLRWGILGAANIARKNWKAIWNSGNGIVSAVASRELARAREFIEMCQSQAPFPQAPRAFSNYEDLVAAPDVDAIYCPLPTALRKPWLLRAAHLGKHIVCEKPCAPSTADLVEVLDACRRRRLQFSDGVMFMHSRRLQQMRAVLDDGQTIGRLRRITSAFTFIQSEEAFTTNVRSQSELEPDGCLGDLGWYCIRLALWVMNWRLPAQVTGRILSEARNKVSREPVPTEFSGELLFDGGVSSTFYCSFITEIEQWAIISGDRGHLRIADFVLPFLGEEVAFETSNPLFGVQGCDFTVQPRWHQWSVAEYSNSHPTAQESSLFRAFADRALSGQVEPAWPEAALKTQQVMDACRESAHAKGKAISLAG